jgi:hypothetical protein
MRGSSVNRSRIAAAACLALSLLALLLWGKLKLVTAAPRTAYAEPKAASGPAPAPSTRRAHPQTGH